MWGFECVPVCGWPETNPFAARRPPHAHAKHTNTHPNKHTPTNTHTKKQHTTKDDTLNGILCFGAQAVAHETDVLYVQVPEDMAGGRLNLWPVGTDDDDPEAPFHTIEPVENKVLRFRGDAIHKARAE